MCKKGLPSTQSMHLCIVFQVLLQSAPEKQIKETGGAHLVLFIHPFNVFKYRFSSRGRARGASPPTPDFSKPPPSKMMPSMRCPPPPPIKNETPHGAPPPPQLKMKPHHLKNKLPH